MGFSQELIAPCGINCGVCLAYLREKDKCSGCITIGTKKVAHCNKCSIKLCEEHNKSEFTYCYECEKYPCPRLKRLEKRYVEKYHLSVVDNLNTINKYGISEFVKMEREKWKCKNCGKVLCVHRSYCLNCKMDYR